MDDPLVNTALKVIRARKKKKNYHLAFAIIYYFIPAFVFAPYIMYQGAKLYAGGLVLVGFILLLVDGMHFYRAILLRMK